jgi:hypothetical protein
MIKKQKLVIIIFLVYFALWYLPGFVFSQIYTEYFDYYYKPIGDINAWHIVWFFLILTSAFLWFFILIPYARIRLIFFSDKLIRQLILVLVVVFALLSLLFYLYHDLSFRHTNRLSETEYWVSLLWFIKPIIYIVALGIYVNALKFNRLNFYSTTLLVLIVISCALSITSSMEVLVPALLSFILYKLNFGEKSIAGKIKFIRFLIYFFISCVVGLLAVLIGLGSKIGYDIVFSVDFSKVSGVLVDELPYLIPRFSTASASFIYWVNQSISGANESYDFLNSINHTFSYRYCLLFGSDCGSNDYIETVNRYNYLSVFAHHAERAGASPGPMASLFLVGNSIYGFFMLTAYFGIMFFLIGKNLSFSKNVSIVYYLLIPLFLMPFFESPLDIFYVIEPLFFQFIFLIFFSFMIRFDKVFSGK